VTRAADEQQLNRTSPHEPPRTSLAALLQRPGPRGLVMVAVAGVPGWHARGQGFKSPQLHQAQRLPAPHSGAVCQRFARESRAALAPTLYAVAGLRLFSGLLTEAGGPSSTRTPDHLVVAWPRLIAPQSYQRPGDSVAGQVVSRFSASSRMQQASRPAPNLVASARTMPRLSLASHKPTHPWCTPGALLSCLKKVRVESSA
jgi:dienelactone hydrolase